MNTIGEYNEENGTLFSVLPSNNEQIEVKYKNSTNKNVWFVNGKFVNLFWI